MIDGSETGDNHKIKLTKNLNSYETNLTHIKI